MVTTENFESGRTRIVLRFTTPVKDNNPRESCAGETIVHDIESGIINPQDINGCCGLCEKCGRNYEVIHAHSK